MVGLCQAIQVILMKPQFPRDSQSQVLAHKWLYNYNWDVMVDYHGRKSFPGRMEGRLKAKLDSDSSFDTSWGAVGKWEASLVLPIHLEFCILRCEIFTYFPSGKGF